MTIYGLLSLCSAALVWVILELIRSKKIAEKYSLMWLTLGLVMLICGIFPGIVKTTAKILDISYAPSLFFLAGLLIAIAMILYLTVIISRLERQQIRLIQELALLKARQDREASTNQSSHPPRTG